MIWYILGGKNYQVFNSAWMKNEWHFATRFAHFNLATLALLLNYFRNKADQEEAVRVTVIALLCELPHLLAWLLYVWARFYPSSSGDVVIEPGYVQARKEEVEEIKKKEKQNMKIIEEEHKKSLLEEEAKRIKEKEEEKAQRRQEIGKNRNFLVAV